MEQILYPLSHSSIINHKKPPLLCIYHTYSPFPPNGPTSVFKYQRNQLFVQSLEKAVFARKQSPKNHALAVQLPFTAGPAAQGETVQIRAVAGGPLPLPPRFGSIQEMQVHSSFRSTVCRATGGTCRSSSLLAQLVWKTESRCISRLQRLLSKSTLVPKETTWKNPPRMESVLCAEILHVICKLKALWKSLMAIPPPEATGNPDTQDKRILSCPLQSLEPELLLCGN